ncbi:hypothetical protein ABW19_dt0205389 [Dactylella cylindrospora]|nr:hypothetical protein ABW19_dt0205389 [Dactylella cylindrospora]
MDFLRQGTQPGHNLQALKEKDSVTKQASVGSQEKISSFFKTTAAPFGKENSRPRLEATRHDSAFRRRDKSITQPRIRIGNHEVIGSRTVSESPAGETEIVGNVATTTHVPTGGLPSEPTTPRHRYETPTSLPPSSSIIRKETRTRSMSVNLPSRASSWRPPIEPSEVDDPILEWLRGTAQAEQARTYLPSSYASHCPQQIQPSSTPPICIYAEKMSSPKNFRGETQQRTESIHDERFIGQAPRVSSENTTAGNTSNICPNSTLERPPAPSWSFNTDDGIYGRPVQPFNAENGREYFNSRGSGHEQIFPFGQQNDSINGHLFEPRIRALGQGLAPIGVRDDLVYMGKEPQAISHSLDFENPPNLETERLGLTAQIGGFQQEHQSVGPISQFVDRDDIQDGRLYNGIDMMSPTGTGFGLYPPTDQPTLDSDDLGSLLHPREYVNSGPGYHPNIQYEVAPLDGLDNTDLDQPLDNPIAGQVSKSRPSTATDTGLQPGPRNFWRPHRLY